MNLDMMCVGKLKNLHKFENLGYSDPITSMCLHLVSMHICVIYEGSMINHMDNYNEKEKWLPSK